MSMLLDAPTKKNQQMRPQSKVNWLVKQLGKDPHPPLHIQSISTRNNPNSELIPFHKLLKDIKECVEHEIQCDPVKFKVIWQVDMGGDFGNSARFIKRIEDELHPFYKNVVEQLKPFQPAVPEMKDD